jgi:heme-degrading monooxygenase HmoA
VIVERAVFTILPGREDEFERTFYELAQDVISQSPGFISARLARGIEQPDTFLLLVEWETLEDHTEGFRGSELFTRWRELLGPCFAEAPAVEHYTPKGDS